MEREILFRGKRLDNGSWWYGSYLFLHVSECDWTGTSRGPKKDVHFIVDETDLNYSVDPATVGQYTGLTDKTLLASIVPFSGAFVSASIIIPLMGATEHISAFSWNGKAMKTMITVKHSERI